VAKALVLASDGGKGEKCYIVYGLVRPRSDLSSLRGIMKHIKFLRGELMDSQSMQDAVAISNPHYVYHYAAQAINGISFDMPRMTLDTNIQGTVNLFEGIRLLKTKTKPRVLVAGSSTEYGLTANKAKGPLSEEAATMPISPYGISKLTTEKLANMYHHSYDIPSITARIFIHVGVGGTDSLAIHEFSKQIALAEIGEGPTLLTHGNLDTARDITDARDSAAIMVKLLETGVPGEAYNVGSGTTTTIANLLDTVMGMAKVNMTHQSLESKFRTFDEAILVADNRKLRALTNWVPSTNMNATVLSILNFWRDKVNMLYGSNGRDL
jgi:GDP-4-dehydro-6-deoxy-D-mannose reductase